eukprot:TRINITY_DN62021_c0_g1_i1.p1 TRINITY_DN62021_c0_g1~~TRINITY_DN62021_c0_g1_i1.p1  ORF type:complete len:384 (+),score=65.62 TRINITY_DN62021_c0_g1_i1:52-1203(+)
MRVSMRPSQAPPRSTAPPPPPPYPGKIRPASRATSPSPPHKRRRVFGGGGDTAFHAGDSGRRGRRGGGTTHAPPPPPPVPEPLPPSGAILVGVIQSYDPGKGYGFIKCDEIPDGADVYFNRNMLPPEAQNMSRGSLQGVDVEFELLVTPDNKPRAEKIVELFGPFGEEELADGGVRVGRGTNGSTDRKREGKGGGPLPPPLTDEEIAAMTALLEEKGGAMDYGKFSNAFPCIKKSQVSDVFVLVPEGEKMGGRWQITLPGVDAMTPEERVEREAQEKKPVLNEQTEVPSEPIIFEPSPTFRMIGCVRKWDTKKQVGFVSADGADDVVVHKDDLPEEVQGMGTSIEGCEITFVPEAAEDGTLKATEVNMLLMPDGEGGWQLRRL